MIDALPNVDVKHDSANEY